MIESKTNKNEDIVWKFLSATRTIHPNTNVSLKMFGVLLYLAKTQSLYQDTNVDNDNPSAFLYLDSYYIDTISGSMSMTWKEKGVYNIAICSKLPKGDLFSEIVSTYLLEFRKVSEPIYIFEIARDLMNNQLQPGDYMAMYEFAIQQHLAAFGRTAGDFFQPKEMTQLVAVLIGTSCDSIYNPFAGTLSYASEITHYTKFDAVEINRDVWELGMLRKALSEHINDISFNLGDVANWTSEKYDAIVSTPPFRMKIDMVETPFMFPVTEASDTVALHRFETTTTQKGELFTFVPFSVLVSDSEEELRHNLTSKGYVDTIIMLPSGIMASTNISTALVVLKKSNTVERPIKMINASSLFVESGRKRILDVNAIIAACEDPSKYTNVTISKIEENQWSWDVNTYLDFSEVHHPEGYEKKQFGQIVDIPTLEQQFEDNKGHVVKISGLANSPYDYIKFPKDFPVLEDLCDTVKCCEPVLLLSTIKTLRPTFCKASKEYPIFVSRNIACFRLSDASVDPGYLCCELVNAKLIPTHKFTRIYLLRINLCFPATIEEQKELFLARKKEATIGKAKELGLQKVIDDMKAEYINTIRTRKHDMRPYVRELGSIERLMRHYVSKKEQISDFSMKMNNLLKKYHIALSCLSDLIDVFSEEEKFGKPVAFNIDEFFYKLKINNDKAVCGHSIEYNYDDNALREYGLPTHLSTIKKFTFVNNTLPSETEQFKNDNVVPLIIDISPSDFERMVKNIIENARTHGFTDPMRNDYIISINLTIRAEKNMFQIDFTNNGTPLPKGMDRNRYGLLGEKAGATGGTGQGGHVVKSIVEHYHGEYDLFMEGGTTVIRILLPISKKYEE